MTSKLCLIFYESTFPSFSHLTWDEKEELLSEIMSLLLWPIDWHRDEHYSCASSFVPKLK